MDAQTKNEIISEITATAVKTIEQIVRESLKRTLPEDLVEKTTEEAVKRIKSSTVPELKIKEIKSDTKERTASWKKSTEQQVQLKKGK